MTLSNDRATAAQIQKEVADLQRKQGDEAKKVADSTKKMNAAVSSANKATNPSSAKTYLGAAERESKNVEAAQDKQAKLASDIARKMGDLAKVQDSIRSGEEKERKAQAATNEKQRREQATAYDKQRKSDESALKALQVNNYRLSRDLASLAAQMTAAIDRQASQAAPFAVENPDGLTDPYDFFISHAWKDKPDFVDALALKAEAAGLSVWYDRQALRWGDSIRQMIDEGLRHSFFGVVIHFTKLFRTSLAASRAGCDCSEGPFGSGSLASDLAQADAGRGRQLCAHSGRQTGPKYIELLNGRNCGRASLNARYFSFGRRQLSFLSASAHVPSLDRLIEVIQCSAIVAARRRCISAWNWPKPALN
jgi:TIR domain